MKCVVLKDKKKLEVGEMDRPISNGKDVIIDVTKAGICGSDIHNWDAGEPRGLVLGHEFCGIVVDPGSRDDLKEGDRVTALPISPCSSCASCLTGNPQYCRETWAHALGLSLDNPGALSETIAVRADMVFKVPDNVTDDEVAMVEPTAVGLHAIHLADIKVGQKVLVIGGGIIGLVSAMFAKKEGASFVAVSETNKARGEAAVSLGVADKYYDALSDSFMNEVMADTGGFDVVIECCGNGPAVSSSLMAVRPGGLVVLVGVSNTPITIPTVLAVLGEVTIKGVIAYTKEEFKTCIDLISNKQIDVMPFVSDIVSFDDVQDAYLRLTSGSDSAIKILVDPKK